MCTDTAYGWTVVWPDMFYVLVEAKLDEEIHCDDVRRHHRRLRDPAAVR